MTDDASRPSAPVPAAGPRMLLGGKYQVIEPLKTGGTALIELAIMRGENNFTREVVLKRPLPHLLADRQLRAMFLDEAHIASRFSHPNVVQVIDLVAREDEIFLVLEHLRGRDLRELIRRTHELGKLMPQDITAYIVAESAAGLGYAHDVCTPDGQPLNLVHRDVSPKNIRITDAGAVKVIDFGIARADVRQSETAPGSVKGTLGYMSPEQVLGELVDRRSDVFSLGICLFQMLTGRNPFEGANLKERVARLIQHPLPNARDLTPDLDPRLDAIVRRALDRDVDQRYPNMSALREDLEEYLADQRLASPRQRLVSFLEAIFPDIHQLTPRLQEALSSSSSLSMRGGLALVDAAREAQANAPTIDLMPASPADPRPVTVIVDPEPTSPDAAAPPGGPPSSFRGDGASELSTVMAGPKATRSRAWLAMLAGAAVTSALIAVWMVGRTNTDPSEASTLVPVASSAAPSPIAWASPVVSASPVVIATTSPVVATSTPARPAPSAVGPRASARPSRIAPRDLLRAGARLAHSGQLEDAQLLYRLAYARSGNNVDPAIYKNLGLLHRQQGEVSKLRACFNMYLSRNARGDDAQRIRAMLAVFPAAPSVPCVAPAEALEAEKIAARVGARIDAWVGGP